MEKFIEACKDLGYSCKSRGRVLTLTRFYDPYEATVTIKVNFKSLKPLVNYTFENERFAIVFKPYPVPKSRLIHLVYDRIPIKLIFLKTSHVL